MKSLSIHLRSGSALAAAFAALSLTSHAQSVSVDGIRDGAEGYTLLATQATPSNWDSQHQTIANLYAKQEGGSLFLHLASKVDGNAIILFLDTKPGGVNFIKNNLITSGGDEYAINSLGSSTTAGLTFESGFNADYAIRIYGTGLDSYVNIYDLTTGVRTYAQNSITNVSSGIIQDMKTTWGNYVATDYATATLGAEMKLSLASMGVPFGVQTVKATAILVNGTSDYASNQVLGSRTSTTGDIGAAIKTTNFESETGTQTLSFAVNNNTDTDGDGITDDTDTDDDNDGLADTAETNTGIYVSASNTGTNPLVTDTDGDSYSDFDEVHSTLGYVSNPNIANYTSMAVPGDYTTPQWKEDGSAGNSMIQGNTSSLTAQYQWTLDYNFRTLGAIAYKYAADGTWSHSWGNGGNDLSATVPAKGFYRFSFNNVTLAQSLSRTVFPNVGTFLTAYGLSAGSDTDGDGISNEGEFAANTDPTSADTDGDGLNDLADANPLVAGGYSSWATANAGGQTLGQDFDGDGVQNGLEYFMGETGSTFTANPQPVSGIVSWPHSAAAAGVTFKVWSSTDLATWTNVTANADVSNPAFVKYTLPTVGPKQFVRLDVTSP
ncbi:MAG: hypothetical protein ABI162_08630 [Luteolibacter sp.]